MSRLRKASSIARDCELVRYSTAKSPLGNWCCILFSKIDPATKRPSSASVALLCTFIGSPNSFSVKTTLSKRTLLCSITLFAASTMFLVER